MNKNYDEYDRYLNSGEHRDLPYSERMAAHKASKDQYTKEANRLSKEWHDYEQKTFFDDIDKRQNEAVEEGTKELTARLKEYEAELNGHRQTIHKAVISKLIEQSPVSEEEADKWTKNNVFVAPNAMDRLKKNKKYDSIESVKADIKEFYRLVGGKLGRIKIVTTGRSRAAAFKTTGEISIDSSFTKQTLFHELGHHVEFGNGMIRDAAQSFRSKRAGDSKLMSLRKLAHKGYKSNEYAYSDGFFDPYVGKHYSDGTTEVISMGLQQLASPDHVLDLMQKDREHLEMVIGMAAYNDPATMALMKAKSGVYEADISKEELVTLWQKELKRVATKSAMEKYDYKNMGDKSEAPGFGSYRGYGRKSFYVNFKVEGDEKYPIHSQSMKSEQDARNFVYLIVATEKGLIPKDEKWELSTIAASNMKAFPAWFTEDTKLPKLEA